MLVPPIQGRYAVLYGPTPFPRSKIWTRGEGSSGAASLLLLLGGAKLAATSVAACSLRLRLLCCCASDPNGSWTAAHCCSSLLVFNRQLLRSAVAASAALDQDPNGSWYGSALLGSKRILVQHARRKPRPTCLRVAACEQLASSGTRWELQLTAPACGYRVLL